MLDSKVSEALEWLRIAKEKLREFASGDGEQRTTRPKIGLALAGGFARGIAHIGVLRAFRDAGIPIDCVAGTSVGALIGVGYCAGVSLERMQEIGQATHFTDFGRWTPSWLGLAGRWDCIRAALVVGEARQRLHECLLHTTLRRAAERRLEALLLRLHTSDQKPQLAGRDGRPPGATNRR